MFTESGSGRHLEDTPPEQSRRRLEALIDEMLGDQRPINDNKVTEVLTFPPLPLQLITDWSQCRYPSPYDITVDRAEIKLDMQPPKKVAKETRMGWLRRKGTETVETPGYKSVCVEVTTNLLRSTSEEYMLLVYYLGLTSGKLPELITSEFVVTPALGPPGTVERRSIDCIRRKILPGDPLGDLEAFAGLLWGILPFEQARQIIATMP